MNSQIIELGDHLSTKQLGEYYRKNSAKSKNSIKKINSKIEKETKVERKNLEKAINKYQTKVKEVINSTEIKQEQTNLIKSKTEMAKALNTAVKKFFKKRKMLYEMDGISTQAKKKKEVEIYNKMLERFFTEEEREEFENMVKNNMSIILDSRQLKTSKLMQQIKNN